jgi:uncharacterized protein (UPF0297 family)
MINTGIKTFISQSYLIYLLLFIAILFIFIFIIIYQFGANIFLNVSLDSSRYLLSAMAQALAAILAIVVGFSFVAFQLSARFGSPRVFDLFLKSGAFWWLLIIYGFSILYDLVLLRMLTKETVELLVNWINISVFLSVISFISLFPYAHMTIDQLKPERIIRGIIKIKNDEVESLKRDTILPIVDILNKALRANDPHTLKVGLEALEKLNIDRIDSSIDSKDKLEIAKYYTGKISRLTKVALTENDESAVIETTESLGKVGLKAIESRGKGVLGDEIAQFKSNRMYSSGVGIPNKTDNYDKIADEIKEVLSNAGKGVIERKWDESYEEGVLRIFDDIFVITNDFSRLSKDEKIFSMQYFMRVIRNIVTKLIQKDIYFDDWQYNNAIKGILEKSLESIDKDNCFKINQIIGYIIDIGIEAVKKNHKLKEDVKEHFKKVATSEKCSYIPISNIGNRGYYTAIDSKKLETIWICSCLKEIGISCALKGLDEPTNRIFSLLEGIENNYRVKFLEKIEGTNANRETDEMLDVTENIITIIEVLGNISIEKRLEKSSREAFASLIEIGMMNDNTNLKKRICETLKHVHLKLEDKEISKSVIDAYEKKQGRELDKFQDFKVFCGFDEG